MSSSSLKRGPSDEAMARAPKRPREMLEDGEVDDSDTPARASPSSSSSMYPPRLGRSDSSQGYHHHGGGHHHHGGGHRLPLPDNGYGPRAMGGPMITGLTESSSSLPPRPTPTRAGAMPARAKALPPGVVSVTSQQRADEIAAAEARRSGAAAALLGGGDDSPVTITAPAPSRRGPPEPPQPADFSILGRSKAPAVPAYLPEPEHPSNRSSYGGGVQLGPGPLSAPPPLPASIPPPPPPPPSYPQYNGPPNGHVPAPPPPWPQQQHGPPAPYLPQAGPSHDRRSGYAYGGERRDEYAGGHGYRRDEYAGGDRRDDRSTRPYDDRPRHEYASGGGQSDAHRWRPDASSQRGPSSKWDDRGSRPDDRDSYRSSDHRDVRPRSRSRERRRTPTPPPRPPSPTPEPEWTAPVTPYDRLPRPLRSFALRKAFHRGDRSKPPPTPPAIGAIVAPPVRTYTGCSSLEDTYQTVSKLGEGTFGVVMKATVLQGKHAPASRATERGFVGPYEGQIVALKRILFHSEADGMPITALREIRILQSLRHPAVVPLLEIATREGDAAKCKRGDVSMVFPYMDHDLAGLLENKQAAFSLPQIKLYAKQLLEGTHYLHTNNILHRDMKAANLLINNAGELKIADFGLARNIRPSDRDRAYTNCVVTRWYRPPELLLGNARYGFAVDLWGVGCVIGEMLKGHPLFPGTSDLDQCERIFRVAGSPDEQRMPGFTKWPGCDGTKEWAPRRESIEDEFRDYPAFRERGVDRDFKYLMRGLFDLDAARRLTAAQALDELWFWTDPLPADPRDLPQYGASHELGARKSRNANIQRVVDGVHVQSRPGTGPPGLPMQPNRPRPGLPAFAGSAWDAPPSGQRPSTVPSYDLPPRQPYNVTTSQAPAPLSRGPPRPSTTGGGPPLSMPTRPRSSVPMPSLARPPPPQQQPPPDDGGPLNY